MYTFSPALAEDKKESNSKLKSSMLLLGGLYVHFVHDIIIFRVSFYTTSIDMHSNISF